MPKRATIKHKSTKAKPTAAASSAKTEVVVKSKSKRARLGGLKTWVWLAVVILVLFEAMINNNQATNGQHLADLQDQQVHLSTEVDELQRQVAATGSLQSIRQRATEQLGLQEINKNVLYVTWPTITPTPPSESLNEDLP